MLDLDGIEYDYLPNFLIWAIPTALLWGLFIWSVLCDWFEWIKIISFVVSVLYIVFGGMFLLVASPIISVKAEKDARIQSFLIEEGFTDFNVSEFPDVRAEKVGEFFRGIFVYKSEYGKFDLMEVVKRN